MIMRRPMILTVTFLSLMVTPAAAQWLKYPTPGVPRDSRGKANLARRHREPPMGSRISRDSGSWTRPARRKVAKA